MPMGKGTYGSQKGRPSEEDKKKGVEDQGTEILYVTPSFFTPFPFFFQEVRERKREEE